MRPILHKIMFDTLLKWIGLILLQIQKIADKIAEKTLNKWISQNKKIQLCLNLD